MMLGLSGPWLSCPSRCSPFCSSTQRFTHICSASSSGGKKSPTPLSGSEPTRVPLSDSLVDLLLQTKDTHYQYLGISPNADMEDIKAAYRRLSKQYHPDSTSLPIEVAAEKFVRLKEAYNVLSSEQERRFYDWTLAQEVSSRQGGRFIWPYEVDRTTGSRQTWMKTQENQGKMDPVDALGGRNMKLSSQAQTALAFDLFAISVSICCVLYAAFFKSASPG